MVNVCTTKRRNHSDFSLSQRATLLTGTSRNKITSFSLISIAQLTPLGKVRLRQDSLLNQAHDVFRRPPTSLLLGGFREFYLRSRYCLLEVVASDRPQFKTPKKGIGASKIIFDRDRKIYFPISVNLEMTILKLIFLTLLTVRRSSQCVAMKPPDFDDIIPLTRIPPTSAARTTTTLVQTTTTIATTTSKSGRSTAVSKKRVKFTDPCDACTLPTIFSITDWSTPCLGATSPTLPQITVDALTDGTTCQLVASGCQAYDTVLSDATCNTDLFTTNPVCQDGLFVGAKGQGITQIRCAIE